MAEQRVRAFEGGVAKAVGERQVRVTITSPRMDRHGDIVELAGIDLTEYRRNPVVLWQHDHDEPIARCVELTVLPDSIVALVQFPPAGTSESSDEAYRLVKAGVVSAASIGFIPREWCYLDDKNPWAGVKYTAVELIEFSFVSVPAQPDALVIERSALRRGAGGAALIAQMDATVALMKAGRVLSGENEAKLRAAHAAIGDVLALVAKEAPRTLYVRRPLLNGDELRAWAREAGFSSAMAAADMHVTIAYSKTALDWSALKPDAAPLTVAVGGARSVQALGDKGAVTLRFESEDLSERFDTFRSAGASWDHDGFRPHVTVTWKGAGTLDLAALPPFAGELRFGGEVFAEIDPDWKPDTLREEPWPDDEKAARLRSAMARLKAARLAA